MAPACLDPRILADILLRLHGDRPLSTEPPAPLPGDKNHVDICIFARCGYYYPQLATKHANQRLHWYSAPISEIARRTFARRSIG